MGGLKFKKYKIRNVMAILPELDITATVLLFRIKGKILPHLYINAGPDSLWIINLPFLMKTKRPRKVGCLDNRNFRQNCRFFIFEKIFQIRYFS